MIWKDAAGRLQVCVAVVCYVLQESVAVVYIAVVCCSSVLFQRVAVVCCSRLNDLEGRCWQTTGVCCSSVLQ